MVAEPMTMPAPIKKWTYDEVQAAFDDDVRRELYDGELWEMPSPSNQHQKIYRRLLKLIEAWIDEKGQGIVYLPPIDLRIDQNLTFIPDLTFYLQADEAAIEHPSGRGLSAPPDLLVEILSPATARQDRGRKYRAYAKFGVRFYWILDPEACTLNAFRLENGAYRDEAVSAENDSLTPALFPGLTINLNEIFGPAGS